MYNDEFVNTNAANVQLLVKFNSMTGTAQQRLSQLQQEFESTVAHDTVNDDAFPVCVYIKNGIRVAWYDWELACGFVS
jgi:hypothetical protein